MFVLKKLFKLRENGRKPGETEKPFMEHLEDLRDVIVKIVITLLIATILCYVFRSSLMDLLRRPIEQVWINAQTEKLPETISPDLWEQAKKVADAATRFTPEQQTSFYEQFENKELRQYAQAATYYRASLLIEDLAKRQQFIDKLPQVDDETKTLLTSLLKTLPSAALNAKGDVVFMRSLKPTETFMLAIKLSVFAGIIISFPFLLYFILQFVLPGLKTNERKALWPALIIGFGLFLLGVFFCYFFVLPKALDFFYSYSSGMGVENEWRIGDYITFTTQFTLIFGLSFELPVVVMTLVKLGLLSYQTMSKTRSYAVLTIFIVGAIITPTGDALTLSLLAVPMCLLYEICIWLAYFNQKNELAAEALEEAEIKEYRDQKYESNTNTNTNTGTTPVPVPVPGRISTDQEGDHADDHNTYHDYHHDDYHDHHTGEEGEEYDDGEIEDFSKTIDSKEEQNDTSYEDDDYNTGASFEAPPEVEEKEDPKEDSAEDADNDPPSNK